jgi:hypothetical protein
VIAKPIRISEKRLDRRQGRGRSTPRPIEYGPITGLPITTIPVNGLVPGPEQTLNLVPVCAVLNPRRPLIHILFTVFRCLCCRPAAAARACILHMISFATGQHISERRMIFSQIQRHRLQTRRIFDVFIQSDSSSWRPNAFLRMLNTSIWPMTCYIVSMSKSFVACDTGDCLF